ncbi:hypothetical protein [Streptomyces sp. H27-S2]|uniref:hypothetical protein n=1 Tax=Streptomyces antarcticus TaxID=2996458 RepID=UPI00226E1D53|nr:hypothetical protein [Streptomyces sp. H27-S2]MCY0952232.1 hypothetical protein [Streptomyces sp. H27-S2]
MTTRTVHPSYAPRPQAPRPGAGRRTLRAVAVAATLPYLTLKAAWLAGSRTGIPDGSVLAEPGTFLVLANSVTLLMDACVIVLVLLLTQPWGMRVPSWLLTVPAFVASGLLTPILLGFPGQLLIRAIGFGADPSGSAQREPFLDPWVFNVVYGGFIVQGLALAGLFVPYARERWGWGRSRIADRPAGGAERETAFTRPAESVRATASTRVVATAAALGSAGVAAAYFFWAFGGTAGMGAERAASWSAEAGVVSAAHAVCALAAGTGALLLASDRGRRAWWPAALAWIGSGAALGWGLWPLIASLGPQLDGGEAPSGASQLIYAGQMATGALAAVVLTRFLTRRIEG